jgi:rhodanese-related sulfurtransferase
MFSVKRSFSIFVLVIMLASVLAGCTPAPTPTPPPVTPDPVPALVPAEVLLEAAKDVLNSIPDNNFMIAPQAALDLMEANPDAIFWVDMRGKDDYDAGHIPGAVHIPYGQIGANLGVLPTNRQIVFQCFTGQTSMQAVALTQMLGFNSISFQGGMNFGWKPLGLSDDTLETEANPLPQARTPELDERQQIIWDAAVAYFSDSSYIVRPPALFDLIDANPDALMMLDTRNPEHFAEGHIDTAVNIPWRELHGKLGELPTNRPIYVTCYSGQTAGVTIAALRMAGFNALSLYRGMIGWRADEMPVVTN